MVSCKLYIAVSGALIVLLSSFSSHASAVIIGERPAVETHLEQSQIESGAVRLNEVIAHGQLIFDARFNALDGQGRPASTGTGAPRIPDQPAFVRTSSPESNSCSGCHAQPRSGGGGDFVANVFVLAQALDPVTFSVSPEFSNSRNTLGIFGAGPIEMLAREMSNELIAIREDAATEAAQNNAPVTRSLIAKGVDFGSIIVMPNGQVNPSAIEGVDWDLIIKPFHQKGAVVSIREFTNNAMNHHHGIQAAERFGLGVDADQDGIVNELTVGDITAITIMQAALATPGRLLPAEKERRDAAANGEFLFDAIGCTSCHVAEFMLNDSHFSEPNPFNPPGNLQIEQIDRLFSFDMNKTGLKPGLKKIVGEAVVVACFTDLKRHNLNDADLNFFANELLPQGNLTGFSAASEFTVPPEPRPVEEFLTRKLWDVGNSMPYGHRGDLTTMTEAIFYHGGDARNERDTFFNLPQGDQNAIIEFLKTLQVLPEK